jgi:hypothetical protein
MLLSLTRMGKGTGRGKGTGLQFRKKFDVDVQSMGKSEIAKLLGETMKQLPEADTLVERLVIFATRAVIVALLSGQEGA